MKGSVVEPASRFKRVRLSLTVAGWIVIVILPFFVHIAMVPSGSNSEGMPAGLWATVTIVLCSFQAGFIAAVMLRRRPVARIVVPPLAMIGIALLCNSAFYLGLAMETGIPHTLLYVSLLTVFGRSLRPGRIPVAVALAVRLGGPRSPRVLAYARGVTKAWCVFFAGQLIVSATLLGTSLMASGPLARAAFANWSFFVNALDLPSLVLMFLGEYAYRLWYLRNEEHIPLATIILAYAKRPDAGGAEPGVPHVDRSRA